MLKKTPLAWPRDCAEVFMLVHPHAVVLRFCLFEFILWALNWFIMNLIQYMMFGKETCLKWVFFYKPSVLFWSGELSICFVSVWEIFYKESHADIRSRENTTLPLIVTLSIRTTPEDILTNAFLKIMTFPNLMRIACSSNCCRAQSMHCNVLCTNILLWLLLIGYI